jgi:hypothetical protein
MYYVAAEKAPLFQPDVYLWTLTPLALGQSGGAHLGEVARQGIEPPYDFMREALKDAGVQRSDSYGMAQLKLAPYRLSLLREMLTRLKSQVTRQGATLAIVLLPVAESPRLTLRHFEGGRELVEGVGLPIVDLLDTWDPVPDIESVRSFWSDSHPNAAGHQLLADNLYRKLRAQPELWKAITGQGETTAGLNKH